MSDTVLPRPAPCDYCRDPIIWTVTVNGLRMPVDGAPSSMGNVQVKPEKIKPEDATRYVSVIRSYVIGKKSQAAAMRQAGVKLHLAHRLSCPRASEWAKGAA